MLSEQIARWREKLDFAYRTQTGTYRDQLTIAAEMLAAAEDREWKMAEAVSATKKTCATNNQCARAYGHDGDCMILGNG